MTHWTLAPRLWVVAITLLLLLSPSTAAPDTRLNGDFQTSLPVGNCMGVVWRFQNDGASLTISNNINFASTLSNRLDETGNILYTTSITPGSPFNKVDRTFSLYRVCAMRTSSTDATDAANQLKVQWISAAASSFVVGQTHGIYSWDGDNLKMCYNRKSIDMDSSYPTKLEDATKDCFTLYKIGPNGCTATSFKYNLEGSTNVACAATVNANPYNAISGKFQMVAWSNNTNVGPPAPKMGQCNFEQASFTPQATKSDQILATYGSNPIQNLCLTDYVLSNLQFTPGSNQMTSKWSGFATCMMSDSMTQAMAICYQETIEKYMVYAYNRPADSFRGLYAWNSLYTYFDLCLNVGSINDGHTAAPSTLATSATVQCTRYFSMLNVSCSVASFQPNTNIITRIDGLLPPGPYYQCEGYGSWSASRRATISLLLLSLAILFALVITIM